MITVISQAMNYSHNRFLGLPIFCIVVCYIGCYRYCLTKYNLNESRAYIKYIIYLAGNELNEEVSVGYDLTPYLSDLSKEVL